VAAEIRYGEIRECGNLLLSSVQHQHCDNDADWGATDDRTKSGMAMDAHAPPRLQCTVETPPKSAELFCIRLCAARVQITAHLYANYP
jgi:hypothetical protein